MISLFSFCRGILSLGEFIWDLTRLSCFLGDRQRVPQDWVNNWCVDADKLCIVTSWNSCNFSSFIRTCCVLSRSLVICCGAKCGAVVMMRSHIQHHHVRRWRSWEIQSFSSLFFMYVRNFFSGDNTTRRLLFEISPKGSHTIIFSHLMFPERENERQKSSEWFMRDICDHCLKRNSKKKSF